MMRKIEYKSMYLLYISLSNCRNVISHRSPNIYWKACFAFGG